ncbi:MAG: DUF929 family protein [Candidatus Aenigmarchaeota archaeon]|nr:DUF929 family protein [Candidatus Aenigmarchaeota archaeon]
MKLNKNLIIISIFSLVVASVFAFVLFSKSSNDDIYKLNTEIQLSSPNALKTIGNYYKQSNESYSDKVTVFFVGTEYCTFCAAERWPLVESLKNFGSFEGLGSLTTPSIGGEYSDLPTYTFIGVKYNSSYLSFSNKETYNKNYDELEKLTPQEVKIVDKYNPSGGAPFLMIAGKKGVYTQVSSGYSPATLSGLTFSQIQDNLKNNTDTKEVMSINKEADIITAIICHNNDNQPENICTRPSIKSLVEKII